jgi:hypothetical protein
MHPIILSHVARRAVEVSSAVQDAVKDLQDFEMPAWGVAVLSFTFLLYFAKYFMVS